jgi:peptide/nickel transport system substrate-binding protein/microcin C transport system substrate-binding protein
MFKLSVLVAVLFVLTGCQESGEKRASSGGFSVNIGGEPTTLNPLTSTDAYAQTVQGYIIEGLLERNLDTYEWEPGLAEKWEVSGDKKAFTFVLREGVKWHDGKPLTVEDVKFSFDAIFDPSLNTAHMRPYFENIEKVEIVDPRTVRFTVKDDYFKNFEVCANGLAIIPKHFYGDASKKKEHGKMLIGTGPYKLASYDKGKRIVLEQNPDWWGRKDPNQSKTWNFPKLTLRFVQEDNVVLESFKKGDLDYIGLRPEAFVKKTEGAEWGTKLFKVKTVNKANKGYTFVGWNMKHPVLSDKKVRRALSMLYNRDLAMNKFEFDLSAHADGPVEPSSDFHPPTAKPSVFDPQGALKLLTDAGWKDTDGDGVLDKMIAGKKTPLSITILEPSGDYMKYLTLYKEEAKKVGVNFELKQIEWNSFIKLIDERKFEAVRLAWGPGAGDPDPKQIWHSSSQNGGSNFNHYANAEVDRMIDAVRRTHERPKRIEMLQKVYTLIAADDPYLFMFAGKTTLYAHNTRIQKTRDTWTYGVGTQYWTLAP